MNAREIQAYNRGYEAARGEAGMIPLLFGVFMGAAMGAWAMYAAVAVWHWL